MFIVITDMGGPYWFTHEPTSEQITEMCPLWRWADIYDKDRKYISSIRNY